jgi:hypothetical protein
LKQRKVINEYLFTICLAPDGGYFSLGGVNTTLHTGNVTYIPLQNDLYHKVTLLDIVVDHKTIDINNSYYTIIDSGTTISYLPEPLFQNVIGKVNDYCAQPNRCFGDGHLTEIGQCYRVKDNVNYHQFKDSMPSFSFIFDENIKYEWKPESYLFNNTKETDTQHTYCMGFAGWK